MKKLISLLLCLVLAVTCSVCALGEEAVVFSFSSVRGKKGEVVLVDFSLESENKEIAAFDMVICYDQSKLRFVENPNTNQWFTGGKILQGGHLAFNEVNMKLTYANANGINRKGVLFTMAFELLEDMETPQSLVAGFFTTLLNQEGEFVKRKVQGAWDTEIPTDLYYNPMEENQVTLSLGKIQTKPGQVVKVPLSINASYTYIEELELQLSYNDLYLQPVGKGFVSYAQADCSYDAQTKVFRLLCEEGLIANGTLGYFEFQVAEDASLEEMSVTATLVKMPTHAKEKDFQYNVTLNNGGVLAEFVKYEYEENPGGLTLTKCSGNLYTHLQIPYQEDGKTITAIGPNAFENHIPLSFITLTNYVTQIDPNAFAGHEETLTLRGGKNSATEAFATLHNIPFQVEYRMADAVTGTDVLAPGDLNGDAFLTAKDALLVLRITVGKDIPTPMMATAANVNGDALINAKDALEILKRSIGKPACF